MARKKDAMVNVAINRTKNVVNIQTVVQGSPVGDVDFTVEEALQHIKHVQTAVDMLLGRSPGGLIMPDGVKVN